MVSVYKMPELQGMGSCRLVVFGIEVGGRWSTEAAQFLRSLAHTKARTVPAQLRHATVTALIARWSASLTHAAMHAYAASLLSMPPSSAITGEESISWPNTQKFQQLQAACRAHGQPNFGFPVWTSLFSFWISGRGTCLSVRHAAKKNAFGKKKWPNFSPDS